MSEMIITEVTCPVELEKRREDVTYENVEKITYYSNTTKCDRNANVILPPGYDENEKYPVLYLQHGIFEDENTLLGNPDIHLTALLGNMMADGMATKTIVVCTNMFATGDPDLKPGFTPAQVAPYDNFINDLVNDLMPYMEANYPVLTGRDNTGIMGFSMGGRESLFIGFSRPDLFAYIGAIAPAPGLVSSQDWAMTHPGQLENVDLLIDDEAVAPKLLLVCCGTKDSVVGSFPKSYHAIMKANGQEHIWYEVPEADHDPNAIKSGIYNFMLRSYGACN